MSEISFGKFFDSISEETLQMKENDAFNLSIDDCFTAVVLQYLEEAGEIEDYIICPFRDRGLQMNAYAIDEDFENATLVVCQYVDSPTPFSVSKTDIDACIKRAVQLFRKAVNDLYTSFQHDSDTYEFAIDLHDHRKSIKSLHVMAITNGTVKAIDLNPVQLEGVDISFEIWDMDRLYRFTNSGKMRETIEIDFQNEFNTAIECIENDCSDNYKTYLAIIPGTLLATLYQKHGSRLLERNVRSFLQVKGQVNRGIRDTLRDEPDMFLAYNNGISVTAESISICRDENGKPSITGIRDMQIVNGGQTTASIYNAYIDKKLHADLSQVFVQMKISVIGDAGRMDEIVPKISACANTQNKIQVADFSANDPFHRSIEELSRITWAPAQGGQKPVNWFYERARGQYSDMLARESTFLKRKQYKDTHPMFTKTDLAKYENSWDQLPYQVSEGAQKNFRRFTMRLNEHPSYKPDIKYYELLIAKAILFRQTEKLVQAQAFGGYRANIVTYSIAFLSNKTGQRIDLERIWKEQKLTTALEQEIVDISKIVHAHITNPPGGANISEWCKNIRCWNSLLETEYHASSMLEAELIDTDSVINSASAGITTLTDEELALIEKAFIIPAERWFELSRWAKETNNFAGWQRGIVFSVGTRVSNGKQPSYKQAKQALAVYEEATKKGF